MWGKHTTMEQANRVPLIIHAPGRNAGNASTTVELMDLFPTLVELADVYMRRCGRPDSGLEADLRLETIATRLGLPVPKGRHTALNDAVFTAALYVRLMHGQRKV